MVHTGLERVLKLWPKQLKGARVGLLVHPASVNRKTIHAVDLFKKTNKICLKGPLWSSTWNTGRDTG